MRTQPLALRPDGLSTGTLLGHAVVPRLRGGHSSKVREMETMEERGADITQERDSFCSSIIEPEAEWRSV